MRKVKEVTVLLMTGAMVTSMAVCEVKQEPAAATTAAQSQESEEETTGAAKPGGIVSEETTGEAGAVENSYTFGYIAYDNTDVWNEYSSKAFEYAVSQADMEVKTIVLDPKSSLEEFITAMESLIQQEVDGIFIFPISIEQGAQFVRMANEANIPVTIENFAMDTGNPGDYIASVTCKYDQISYVAIEYIAETRLGARVFSYAGQEDAGVYERYQEDVDRALVDLDDQVEVVATLHSGWPASKTYNVTTDFVSTGQELDYIFANNGMVTQGYYQALKDADITDIPVVSTGGSPNDYRMLQDGVEATNMTTLISIQGVQTFKNLYDVVVEGKTPEEFVSPLIVSVSAGEPDEFIAWGDYTAAYDYVHNK